MANHSIRGETQRIDRAQQRIANGTVGGEQIMNSSIAGKNLNSIASVFDNRLSYDGSWYVSSTVFAEDYLGYQAISYLAGSSATLSFTGTSIAIVGQTSNQGGRFDVYIDDELAYGMVNSATTLAASYYTAGGLNATDTEILVASVGDLASSGIVQIDDEQIYYSGVNTVTETLTGCIRGYNDTVAEIHNAATTVTQVNSVVETYSEYGMQRIILWRTNRLAPGDHTLRIVMRTDYSSSAIPTIQIYINGFIIGGVLGASNINTNIRYIKVTSVSTDGNGNTGIVGFSPADSNQQLLVMLGAYPISGCNRVLPMYEPNSRSYVFNTNAVSSTVSFVCSFIFIGQTI